jgi:uncharacterized protein YdhG (YjbR/CyaY superfamily)
VASPLGRRLCSLAGRVAHSDARGGLLKTAAPTVPTYIEEAVARRRPALKHLRDLCRNILIGFTEGMDFGMPSYKRDGEVEIAFASQKKYISLYILREDVLDAHRDRLGGISVGNGCVRYTSPEKIDYGVVQSMLERTAMSRGPIC